MLPLVAVLYAMMTADSARRHYAGRGGEWKGRTVSARSGQSAQTTSKNAQSLISAQLHVQSRLLR